MQRTFVAMKAFIVNEENDTIFLMRKGNKDALNPGKWEVPGGKMEFGETTDETFKREVKEESGLDIEVGDKLIQPWRWSFTKPNGDEVEIIAVGKVCRALNNEVDYSHQTATDDLVESGWVPIDEVLNYDLIPNLVPSMESFVRTYTGRKLSGNPIFEKAEEEHLSTSQYTGDAISRMHR